MEQKIKKQVSEIKKREFAITSKKNYHYIIIFH
jgi:hypothetical protein